jgi:anti-anti-sigma factor
MAILSKRQSAVGTSKDLQPRDRCRFGPSFDSLQPDCPAFQRAQFVAATSYGKPLGTHVACAHLMVGELDTNQFYPRCALGSDLERMRWLAMMGPGRIEVLRSLNAEFERLYPDSLMQLITAKAAALAAPADDRGARAALAAVVRDFVAEFSAFITKYADRIADIGYSPIDLATRVTHVLGEWQHSARLDLPGADEDSILRPEGFGAGSDADVVATAGLLISHAHDATLSLVGSIDEANTDALCEAIENATRSDPAVTIDLSAVTFCSVAGLRVLVAAEAGGNVTLRGIQPRLRRAMSAAGLVGDASAGPAGPGDGGAR